MNEIKITVPLTDEEVQKTLLFINTWKKKKGQTLSLEDAASNIMLLGNASLYLKKCSLLINALQKGE